MSAGKKSLCGIWALAPLLGLGVPGFAPAAPPLPSWERGPGGEGAAAAASGALAGAGQLGTTPGVTDAIALLEIWIREQMIFRDVPGLVLGVVHAGDLVWSQGYGWSDREARTPVTPATEFRLGSLTKLFTATAILQLRDRGELALDDPVRKHLPWFAPGNPFPQAPPVTLRHLLTHTSGLPREGAFPYWTTHQFPSREQVRAALPGQSLVLPPGETYKYSNLGMALLGEVVSAASGEDYAEYIRRHLFEPLGMKHSTVAPSPAQVARLARQYRRRLPDGSRGTFEYYDTGGIAPAAAGVSNLEDLARFAAFQLGHGGASGGGVLSAATLAEMQRPQFVYPSWTGGRGLGFAVSRRDQATFASHAGWIGGHRVELLLHPESEIAVIALTNADDASPGYFARKTFELVGRAVAAAAGSGLPARASGGPDPAWKNYLGVYSDPWDWEYEVLILDGELVLYGHDYPPTDDPEESVARLTPVGPHTFRMADGELVVFELDADGRVLRMRRRSELFLPRRRP